jgi:hypothetical protein
MTDDAADYLFSYRYRLTRADLPARPRSRREITGWRKFVLFAPAFLTGAGYATFEDDVVRLVPWLKGHETFGAVLALAIVYGALALAVTFITLWRVRRLPLPAMDTLVQGDMQHLAVTEDGRLRFYAWELLHVPIITADHLFLLTTADDIVTIPLRAFTDRDDMAFFASTIRDWITGDDCDGEAHVS